VSTLENGAGRTARVRRVVTGVDERGRSYVVSDGEAPNVFRSPTVSGFGAAQVWTTPPGPVSNEGAADQAPAGAEIPMYPDLGGTIFRVADFPPDSAYDNAGKDGLFADIGGEEARGGATHSGDRHFWFHKTDSIDFECWLEAGDVIVQRGTAHSWSNRSGKPCRMAFLLLGALPVPAAETAEEKQLAGRRT
jgi:hypothetical protein